MVLQEGTPAFSREIKRNRVKETWVGQNLLIIHDKKLASLCTKNWQNHYLWDLF